MEFRLTIVGDVVAKQRPRFRNVKTKDGREFTTTYTPGKTRKYEASVRDAAVAAWKGAPPLHDVEIQIDVTVYRAIPTSYSKRSRAMAIAGALHPITKPDWDNYAKSVTDALNGVVYHDDSQITDAVVRKRFSAGETGRVEILVSWNYLRANVALQLPEAPSTTESTANPF